MPERRPPVIVAHRGIHHGLPENSREAIWKALDDTFWVELDVHAAADGVPVVIHDDTLDRTTNATGPVSARTSEELKRIGLRGGGLLPTLEDVMAREFDTRLGWVIEIKPPDARELVQRVYDLARRYASDFLIQSFDANNVRDAMQLPDCPTALLIGDERELRDGLLGDAPRLNLAHRLLTPQVIEDCHAEGVYQIGAWTVNEEPDIRRVIDLGVETIISDKPERVREIVNALRT